VPRRHVAAARLSRQMNMFWDADSRRFRAAFKPLDGIVMLCYVMLCIFFVRGAVGPEKSPRGAQDVLS
jgi:hypothetical protein